jgi:hypothetical protein
MLRFSRRFAALVFFSIIFSVALAVACRRLGCDYRGEHAR